MSFVGASGADVVVVVVPPLLGVVPEVGPQFSPGHKTNVKVPHTQALR
jgi:hypothetical protein